MATIERPDVTDRDGRNEEFRDKWDGWDEEERWQYVEELRRTQSGNDRKVRELVVENKDLKAELETSASKQTSAQQADAATLTDIQQEIATVRAERELVKRQTHMIERALDGGIDPALAVRFAETVDADDTFDLAVDVIEKKVKAGIQSKLLDSVEIPTTAGEPSRISWQDIMKMPEAQQRRLPQQVLDRAVAEASK